PGYVQLAYLFAWPGLNATAFFSRKPRPRVIPSLPEWYFALAKTVLGAALFWGLARQFSDVLVQGWIGMAGLVFLLHFGIFALLMSGGPAFALFHPPFVRAVMIPFMNATGALRS